MFNKYNVRKNVQKINQANQTNTMQTILKNQKIIFANQKKLKENTEDYAIYLLGFTFLMTCISMRR